MRPAPSPVSSISSAVSQSPARLRVEVPPAGFLVTIYLLFFFLRDRRAVLEALRAHLPLPGSATDRLCERVVDTIHATVYGTLLIAVAKGTLGGLMFWWLGLPAALLWGVVMGLLAVVPIFGAFIVWIPATLFLAAEGSWGKAVILAIWGTVVIGGIDNVLYPILIGNRLKMHTVLVFISVIGGGDDVRCDRTHSRSNRRDDNAVSARNVALGMPIVRRQT